MPEQKHFIPNNNNNKNTPLREVSSFSVIKTLNGIIKTLNTHAKKKRRDKNWNWNSDSSLKNAILAVALYSLRLVSLTLGWLGFVTIYAQPSV